MTAQRKMKLLLAVFSASAAVVNCFSDCKEFEWKCDRTRCIPKRWMCDGDPDCSDGTDEQPENCHVSESKASVRDCRSTELKCGNDNCIPMSWWCDGANDCGDNSDEEHCGLWCADNEFRCQSNHQCIDILWVCNGATDCEDGSDEKACLVVPIALSPHQFKCKSGTIISKMWVCDGEFDCPDRSDEMSCTPETLVPRPSICRDDKFQCGASCIMKAWVCDGTADCINGEDERDCETCPPNYFLCSDTKQCLPNHHRCNAIQDCSDGSDELDCPTLPSKPSAACNLTVQFQCKRGNCIQKTDLCDGKDDCNDKEDESEETCGINECERNNGGCTQKCINTRDGHYCGCDRGYRLVGKYTCEDINECQEIPGTCSQRCINTIGGYHCTCLPGYKRDPGNYTRCKAAAASGEPYLLFSHRYDIRLLRLRDRDMISVIKDARGATALDYKFTSDEIIWSNNKENEIVRANSTNPENREVLVRGERISADGLAVDWIHNHIYYTDTGNFKISMITWDAAWEKTIVSEELGQPRAIVVSPFDGYIFWTDWGSDPKIERSGLDGSDRTPIIRAPYVSWPNGITMDHSNNHIYWCDGKLNSISRANLDGSQVEVILFSPSFLRLPYSITVFEDRLYWTDWARLALFSANKFNGGDIMNISAGHLLESPKVVHVLHEYRQPSGENVCEDHQCSHFCIRSPAGNPVCSCPDGMLLSLKDSYRCLNSEEDEQQNALPSEALEGHEQKLHADQTGIDQPAQIGMILGIALGSSVMLIVGAIIFVVWWRSQKDVEHIRFHNPVYSKRRNQEVDEDGLVIRKDTSYDQNDSQYTKDSDTYTREDDKVPLTPDTRVVQVI